MPIDLMPSPSVRAAPGEWRLTGRHVFVMLVAFFLIIIGVNGVLAYLALSSMPGTDVKSAYEASQRFNTELAAARQQQARDWRVSLSPVNPEPGRPVELEVRDASGALVAGLDVSIAFRRPIDTKFDTALRPAEVMSGIYRAAAPELAPGQWDVVIELRREGQRLFLSRERITLKE